MTASSRLRIGVLGAANIARMFCTSVAPSSAVMVSAVASRTKDKAEAFASAWHGENGCLRPEIVESCFGDIAPKLKR